LFNSCAVSPKDPTRSAPPSRPSILSFLLIAAALIGGAALNWTTARAAETPSAPQKETGYLPSISDFMIATIQPRHIRLWIAGQRKNWPFAAYELGNLKGAFDRLGRAHPTDHEFPLQDMIASVTAQPFADLGSAIKSKDTTGFAKAYGGLTTACNSCHEGTNHGVVVIRVPQDSLSADQDFEPAP
jgi:hypothetical protein